jgi:hypothetical protein
MSSIQISNHKHQSKHLTLGLYIKGAFSFKYISNLSIIVSIISYYLNAYDVFFIIAPLVFVNLIILLILQIFEYDNLMMGLLGNEFPDKKNRDKQAPLFAFAMNIWHIVPVLWLFYIFKSHDVNIVKIFHPNFMGTFLKSSILPLIYYYFESNLRVYGDVNYLAYLILYMGLLLATCIYLYY